MSKPTQKDIADLAARFAEEPEAAYQKVAAILYTVAGTLDGDPMGTALDEMFQIAGYLNRMNLFRLSSQEN